MRNSFSYQINHYVTNIYIIIIYGTELPPVSTLLKFIEISESLIKCLKTNRIRRKNCVWNAIFLNISIDFGIGSLAVFKVRLIQPNQHTEKFFSRSVRFFTTLIRSLRNISKFNMKNSNVKIKSGVVI